MYDRVFKVLVLVFQVQVQVGGRRVKLVVFSVSCILGQGKEGIGEQF